MQLTTLRAKAIPLATKEARVTHAAYLCCGVQAGGPVRPVLLREGHLGVEAVHTAGGGVHHCRLWASVLQVDTTGMDHKHAS